MENKSGMQIYFYQGQSLTTQVNSHDPTQSFLFANSRLLGQRQVAGAQSSSSLVLTEFKGSVVAVARDEGMLHYTYTPYGHGPEPSPIFLSPGFTGAILDPILGGYMLGNGVRVYNPKIMRFCTADSLSPFSRGGINSYAYCEGDPVNYSDPTGRVKFPLPNRSRLAVARAKKFVIQRRRAPFLKAYAEASDDIKVLIVNKQRTAGWKLDIYDATPEHAPQRQVLLAEAVRELDGLFSSANNAEIRRRYKAFVGGTFQAGGTTGGRQYIVNSLATRAALGAIAYNARLRASGMGRPIMDLTPPPSPD